MENQAFIFALTIVNNIFTIKFMIGTFADTETERFYTTGKPRRFSKDVLKRAVKRLTQLDMAMEYPHQRPAARLFSF